MSDGPIKKLREWTMASDGLIDFLNRRLDEYAHEGNMWHEGCDLADPDGCRCEVFLFVKADVQAKRAILDLHRDFVTEVDRAEAAEDGAPEPNSWCVTCSGCGCCKTDWPCDTIRALAHPFADHPDFDQRWSLPERTTE